MHQFAPPLSRTWVLPALIAVSIVAALALFALPPPWNLAPVAIAGVCALAAAAWRRPDLLVACLPAWLPPPQFAKVFAYEVMLLAVAGLVVLAALRTRRAWLTTLQPFEIAVIALFGWALTTGMWVRDPWWFMFGIRKMGIGVLALWTSWRLARVLPARTMLLGIAVGALTLSAWTLAVALRVGSATGAQSISTLAFSRTKSTDLGWGTSNFIGAILVLMLPTALLVGLHAKSALHRWVGWITLPFAALVMAVSASRGGSILMLLVALYVVLRERAGRRTWIIVIASVLSLGLLIVGPLGQRLLMRFTDVRELGSMVIRLFYFREAGRRLLANLPFGIGWGQGYGYPDHLNYEDPHNYLLVVGSELGIPGLLLWFVVLAMLWQLIGRMVRNPHTAASGRALQLTFVISQANSLFEPTFQGLQYHFLFYWIVGAYLGAFGAPAGRSAALRERSSEARTTPVVT